MRLMAFLRRNDRIHWSVWWLISNKNLCVYHCRDVLHASEWNRWSRLRWHLSTFSHLQVMLLLQTVDGDLKERERGSCEQQKAAESLNEHKDLRSKHTSRLIWKSCSFQKSFSVKNWAWTCWKSKQRLTCFSGGSTPPIKEQQHAVGAGHTGTSNTFPHYTSLIRRTQSVNKVPLADFFPPVGLNLSSLKLLVSRLTLPSLSSARRKSGNKRAQRWHIY